jgi:hypothetical protein
MQIRKGKDRIVIILPLLGIVIKFPIVHFFLAVIAFFHRVPKGKKWEYLKKYISLPIEYTYGFRWLLFTGISANWNEFWFWWKTRNSFLQPTYFSLFGLLNIQQYDQPCQLLEDDLWCQLYELTNSKVFDDSHHFTNPRNFCFSRGKLRMLDYGSRLSQRVVEKYGEKIFELFNPDYCWEEEKKKLEDK